MFRHFHRAPGLFAVVIWSLSLFMWQGFHAATTVDGAHYNDYLTTRLHEQAATYFDNVPAEVYTVMHYRIAPDGTLLDSNVLETNGTPQQAHRAIEMLEACGPFKALRDPDGIRYIEVTELVWTEGEECHMAATSLAASLRHPETDGRVIELVR